MTFLAWRVEKKRLVLPSGNTMTATCHHSRSGACGGCYARVFVAFREALEADDPKSVLLAVQAAMRAEAA